MTERFKMPLTWEMDRARAFVGGSLYHSCMGTRGISDKRMVVDVILTIFCLCAKIHENRSVMRAYSRERVPVFQHKFHVCQWL